MVLDSLRKSGIEVHGVFDHNRDLQSFAGHLVEHTYDPEKYVNQPIIIAIGDNRSRADVAKGVNHPFGKVIDPSALIAAGVPVLEGSMVLMGAIIQIESRVGRHVIINTGAIVEHDCTIGDFVHIGPGCVICGNVNMKKGAFVGANATVLPGTTIGAWATIGAGSVVLRDVSEGEIVAGNPARVISK